MITYDSEQYAEMRSLIYDIRVAAINKEMGRILTLTQDLTSILEEGMIGGTDGRKESSK